MEKIRIFGIGNPLIDILVHAKETDLEVLGLDKGIMRLVDLEERGKILDQVKERDTRYTCGGSAPNTLIFLSALGVSAAIAGKIGQDEYGRRYAENLPKEHMQSQLIFGDGATGSSVILVTPDSERTMNTYLGANREFCRADMELDVVKSADYLYFTGYMWDTELQKEAVLAAVSTAHEHGIQVVFDVADPFAVNRNRNEFLVLIERHADIVFANREEAKLLFDTDTAEDAVGQLSELCGTAIVKDGSSGSLIKQKSADFERIPVRKIEAVDTTGAGDMYASGFLYGLVSGMSIRDSGICASYLASRIVETWGAQFSPEERSSVAAEVRSGVWRFSD